MALDEYGRASLGNVTEFGIAIDDRLDAHGRLVLGLRRMLAFTVKMYKRAMNLNMKVGGEG